MTSASPAAASRGTTRLLFTSRAPTSAPVNIAGGDVSGGDNSANQNSANNADSKIADAKPSAEHPPGYYGPAGSPRSLNLLTPKSLLKPLPAMPLGVERFGQSGTIPDLYRAYGLDADAILDAAARLCIQRP